jgi:hypothetical protein
MPATTWLGEHDFRKPTSNTELNNLLMEVRSKTGRDWRVAEHKFEVYRGWRFWRKPEPKLLYEVYVETVKPEFQVINFYRDWDWSINHHNNVELVVAYLMGILTGLDEDKARADLAALQQMLRAPVEEGELWDAVHKYNQRGDVTITIPAGEYVGPLRGSTEPVPDDIPVVQHVRSTLDVRLVVREMEDNSHQLALFLDDGRQLPNQVDLHINSLVDNVPTITCSFLVDERVRIERIPTP